jgi:hypothetical protein
MIEVLEQRQLLSATLSVSSSLMVFNAVQNSSPSPIETLTLTDTGDADLTLGPGSATVGTARFTVVNESSIPQTLAPGASFGLQLQYNAVAVGINTDTLSIVSNDPNSPASVTLNGIGTAGTGGSNQPSLLRILEAYDIPTQVGETNVSNATYPQPPAGNSQEVSMQQLVKAGSGPVTIDVLASFTNSEPKPYILGYYAPGNPAAKTQLFYTPTSESQSVYVQPQGITSFDPGSARFGMYFYSSAYGYYGYSEDALNTWDTTDDRKFRFFPMETSNGTVVPDEYIMTSTEYDAPAGYDFTNIVAIISNVEPAPSANTGPVINVTHSNTIPGSSTLMFDTIQNQNPTLGDTFHSTNTVTISNTGTNPLTVTSATLSDTTNWELVNPPTFPLTIADGASTTLTVKFIATTEPSVPYNETNGNGGGQYGHADDGGVYDATLSILSNDPTTPSTVLPLAGYWQYHSENNNEPSAQTVINLLAGYGTNINSTPIPELTESEQENSSPTYYGEEVVSSYWAEADSTQPVSVIQLDAFHTQGYNSGFYYFNQGSSSTHQILYTSADSGQSLFPLANGSSSSATGSFTNTGDFGFSVIGGGDTVDSADSLNSDSDFIGGGHDMRFYPVRTSTGSLVPNTYIVLHDYPDGDVQNYDFQDNVYIVSNIRPVTTTAVTSPRTTAAAPAPASIAGVSNSNGTNSLQWVPLYGDSSLVGYNVYSSVSATSGFTLLNTAPLTTPSYVDTDPLAGTTIYYRVTAVDSVGESLGTQTSVLTAGTAPTGLQSVGIGETPAGSTTVVTAGSAYNVSAGGPGVTGTTDGFQFIYEPQAGNFDVKVQVQSITVAGNYATAGIMARSTLDASSANVYMSASPVNYRFKDRTSEDGTTNVVAGGASSFPGAWVRLQRVGNVFNGYSSADGVHWTLVSTLTLALPDTVYLGLAVASNDTTQTTTAQLASYGNTSNGPVTTAFSGTAISGVPTVLNVLSVDTDPTGTIDPTTVTITTPPNQGGQALVNTSNGTITYTSAPGFTGTETFSYTVGDDIATSQPAVVTVTVSPSGLVTNPVTFNVVAGQTLLANVLAGDTDSTGTINPATLSIITGDESDPNATVAVQSGEISYTPNANFTGTDTVVYTVQDSNDTTSVPTTVTFDVSSGDSGPVTNPVSTSVATGQNIQINVLATDTSANGLNPATVTIVSAPSHGTTAVNTSTGFVTYTPAANFSGTDSFTYTVKDDNGVVSQPATVTIQVIATGPVAANINSPVINGNGSTSINVLAQATDGTGTLTPASVTITTAPADGTATVNTSNGTIDYTPRTGFVGTDTLQYTVGDGVSTSAPATLSLAVGLTINTTTAKSLSFVDSSGNHVTVAITGGGTGEVFFTGAGTATDTLNKRGTSGTVSVNGTGLGISSIDITGTTAASSLTITRRGISSTPLGGISVTGAIGRINAPTSALTGTLAVSGAASSIQLASINGATITIGSTGAKPGGLSIATGNIVNTTVASAIAIKSLSAGSWIGTSGSITAPSIASLVTSGSIASGWTGDFSGVVGGFTVRSGGFAGTLTAGNITSLSITGNDTGSITAGSIRSVRIAGELSGGSITLTNGVTAGQLALGRLTVTGKTVNSTIDSAGSIGAITTAGITGSSIDAGVNSGVTLPGAAADFSAAATISSLAVTGRGSTFANTDIGAQRINSLSLGEIITAGNGAAFGIGADTIKAFSASLDSGGVLKPNTKELLSSADIDSYIAAHSLRLNEFVIRPGL